MTAFMKTILLASTLAFTSVLTLSGCEEGPFEEAGEAADQAVEEAGDAVENATD